ncbi:glycosyl transferase family 90 [Chryseobacterium taeanense]|uniref:glycosyl transferase family 90 n=1 Tax=Chryseobacterium taeanense TaxID=311334 RepID=UPI0035B3B998
MWLKKKKTQEQVKELLNITIRNGQIALAENHNSFQTRAESSLKQVLDAIAMGVPEKEIIFSLNTGDFPVKKPVKGDFYYCCERKEDLDFVFPDFIFDHWKQAGIPNFGNTVSEISEAAKQPYDYERMLWIGNVQTNIIRKKIIQYSEKFPDLIEAYDTCVDQVVDGKKDIPYISLKDHTKYKYLIDIEGRGYSGRIKMLLFTKRLLFIQERQWKSYYHFELEPYKHFIPVKNDLSDLIQQIEFTESQGENYYDNITQNAYNFAVENLRYEKAVARIKKLISGL